MKKIEHLSEALDLLIQLASMPAGRTEPLLSADLVHQDNLYAIQEHLSEMLVALAVSTPGGQAKLLRAFPGIFSRER